MKLRYQLIVTIATPARLDATPGQAGAFSITTCQPYGLAGR